MQSHDIIVFRVRAICNTTEVEGLAGMEGLDVQKQSSIIFNPFIKNNSNMYTVSLNMKLEVSY